MTWESTALDVSPGAAYRRRGAGPPALCRVVGLARCACTGRSLVVYQAAGGPGVLLALPPAVFASRWEPAEGPAPERPPDPPPPEKVIDCRTNGRE